MKDKNEITTSINKMIKKEFNLDIPIYIIESKKLEDLLNNKPDWWGTNNKEIYDNIIFVIEPFTFQEMEVLMI